jgi:hypothetical protein
MEKDQTSNQQVENEEVQQNIQGGYIHPTLIIEKFEIINR